MIEAAGKSVLHRQRAAEAHAADQREALAPLQQEPHHFKKILIPAHGDAVFGHPAEAPHDAIIEWLLQVRDASDGTKGRARAIDFDAGQFRRQRLDFQAVNTHHGVALVQQMMRQCIAGRPHAGHQHPLAGARTRQWTAQI